MSTKIADQLNALLSDYQVLYQKLRNYHWNVKGPFFFGLHAQFEELYNAAAMKVDELAERVGALGVRPTSTLAAALQQSRLKEDTGTPGANDMVSNLVADYRTINEHLRATAKAADGAGDQATLNLLDGFADEQEKTIWMFEAFLQG